MDRSKPYCVCYDNTHYFFLDRDYRLVYNNKNPFQYPKLKNEKRIYFYDDGTKPINVKNKKLYELKKNSFLKFAKDNNLLEINYF